MITSGTPDIQKTQGFCAKTRSRSMIIALVYRFVSIKTRI
jgi:hypothetical protein